MTWATFYASRRDDGGIYGALFAEKPSSLLQRTLRHFESPSALTESVAGHPFGVTMVVPTSKGTIAVLHHGFTYFHDDGFHTAFTSRKARALNNSIASPSHQLSSMASGADSHPIALFSKQCFASPPQKSSLLSQRKLTPSYAQNPTTA
jgi:hypothetical protein